jgi:hypothetical protein
MTKKRSQGKLRQWLFKGVAGSEGPHEEEGHHHQHPWWKVMCLTGVDYFSTLGYQPGIAFLAAGVLSPIATMILVLLTLFGALPIYNRVAAESPHGEGSISMLENLLSRWKGKLFVLVLLGFVATDFIITITLSAADATAHVIENPFVIDNLPLLRHPVGVTLALIGVLAAVFLKGFKEAIGIAVVLVGVYLTLNCIVIGFGIFEILTHPTHIPEWKNALFQAHGNPLAMVGVALLLFPKLALGLSGFETGVAVMPLVQSDQQQRGNEQSEQDAAHGRKLIDPNDPVMLESRVRNTRQLLRAAALIMSVLLIASSFVTTMLIPAHEFAEGGKASGRALSFLAHTFFGDVFGSVYDVSTIFILWFAGASAMAGLLNIVPRYLPRYGMAPDWTRATRPLVLVFTTIAFFVTIAFKANVEAQGGAYATGVLVLMTSAAVAVTLSVWRKGGAWWAFMLIALVFAYTTVVNVIERPEGIKIASFFIGAIIFVSFVSRIWRSTELRTERIELDETAQSFIDEVSKGEIRIITNQCPSGDPHKYMEKVKEEHEDTHLPHGDPVIFLEITVGDASNFSQVLKVHGVNVGGYKVLRAESPTVPNAIAAFLLHLRDETGKIPHAYFGWSEGNPLKHILSYVVFGEGDTAPVTHEVLRQAEEDPERRPAVHVGG